jgi:hypothetical protein
MLEFLLWQDNVVTDSNILQIGLRFLIDLIVITILVRFIYFGQKRDKEYVFTFFLFNVLIFFVCYMMLKVNISMGFAFGLFAIFGILRYRTNTIPIKEMTYLFTAITLALINAISPIDWTMAFMNLSILTFVYTMERLWFANKEQYKNVTYDRIDLIENGQNDVLIADLNSRTGLKVARYEIKSMNFLNDSAVLKIYFTQ